MYDQYTPWAFWIYKHLSSPHQNIFVTAHFANSLFLHQAKKSLAFLHTHTPCQVLVINLDKTFSMAKFSWSFVRWVMLQTVNWVILPNGMMQNTLQLIMPQVCHTTCSAILPALTLGLIKFPPPNTDVSVAENGPMLSNRTPIHFLVTFILK